MTTPAISVIMGVYNRVEYLEECVYSILNQTFTDFEFIIVDDASTDTVPEVLARLATEDSRIRIITNAVNKHIPATLNIALHEAKAPYVAVMDSDDWSHPDRLAKQYAFLEANPHVGLCATQVELYGSGKSYAWPRSDAMIRASMLLGMYFHHPTVLMRKDLIIERVQGYDETMLFAQDYDLWARLAEHKDVLFANLPEVLFRYRKYPDKNRAQHIAVQIEIINKVRFRLQQQLGIEQPNLDMHCMLSLSRRTKDPQELRQCGQWMHEIQKGNAEKKIYDPEFFLDDLHLNWAKLCYRSLLSLPEARHIYKEYRLKPTSLFCEILQSLQKSGCKRIRGMKRRLKGQLLCQNTANPSYES